MNDPLATIRTARSAATALGLFAVVHALVLLVAEGVAAALPALLVLGLTLIALTPFLALWALGLLARRLERGGSVPVPLVVALGLMMIVPALFWGLGLLSRVTEAFGALPASSLTATAISLMLAVAISGLPAALSGWLALAFLRLGLTPAAPRRGAAWMPAALPTTQTLQNGAPLAPARPRS